MGAARSHPALRRCIAMEPGRFAAEVWSRRPLLSTAAELAADGFADLFSLDAVDELLSRRGLRTPFLRVARDGAVVPAARYTRGGGTGATVADQVADDRVLDLFVDGHTVVLQGLHRTWGPLIDFAGSLATELGHPVQVNAYVTPEQSQGFAAHYDTHDVFVLQVAGQKRWRVHEPVHPDPLSDEPWTDRRDAVAARAREEPALDTVLRPGDALYLPRGFLHSAVATGGVTCHLTVGVHPVTRHTLIQELLGLLAARPELRRSLPLGIDPADPATVAADVEATLDAVAGALPAVTAPDLAARLAARLLTSNRPAPIGPLAQAAALARLGPDTVLRARVHQRVALSAEGDTLQLRLGDRTLRLPADTAKAVRALLDGEVLRVADLPGLDEAGGLALARRLVREAVAVVEPAT